MRTHVGGVRRPFWIALCLALVASVGVPTLLQVRQWRDQQAVARVQKLAGSVSVPAPMTPLVLHHDCNGTGLVYCGWTADAGVDSLLRTVAADVTRKAGTRPRVVCWSTGGVNSHGKDCMVQVLDGRHEVAIFVEPYVRRVDGRLKTLGTRYTVQTS